MCFIRELAHEEQQIAYIASAAKHFNTDMGFSMFSYFSMFTESKNLHSMLLVVSAVELSVFVLAIVYIFLNTLHVLLYPFLYR